MLIRCLMLVVALTAATAARSEDATASRTAAAQELMRISRQRELMAVRIDLVVDNAAQQLHLIRPELNDKAIASFRAIFRQELGRDANKLIELRAAYYADHFSEAEINAWIKMLQSEVGQKVVNTSPDVLRDLSPADIVWVQGATQRAAARFQSTQENGASGL